MNSSPSQSVPQTTNRGGDREPKPNAEIGSKIKEAEANLLQAEAKLTDDKTNPGSASSSPSVDANASPDPNPNSKPNADQNARGNDDASTRDEARERLASPVAENPPATPKEKAPHKPLSAYISENVAGILCYLFAWVGGLVFLLIDRRPFVRYHAAQSVAVFATLSILLLVLSDFFLGAIFPSLGGALLIARRILELTWLVAAVLLMLRAAAGEKVRVGPASAYADRAVHTPN